MHEVLDNAQDTSFVSTLDPRELYVTDQLDQRLKLAHVHAACDISVKAPRMQREGQPLSPGKTHFCMYHWDHVANSLRPIEQ